MRILIPVLILLTAATAASAQMEPVETLQKVHIAHSGHHDGLGHKSRVVWRETIRQPETPWIRLEFGRVDLGRSSTLVIRSVEDGDEQVLDATTLGYWENRSAYFNGDAVEIELHAGAGDRDVFAQVARVVYTRRPEPIEGEAQKSICGNNDDRIPSNDGRVARLQGIGGFCTAWLIPNGIAATAGHCGNPDGDLTGGVLHFNVPASDSDGTANPATVANQYPVNSNAVSFQADGEGDDWALFPVNPNMTTGLTAHEVRGWFKLTDSLPGAGATLRVTGNGIDADPPGTVSGSCNDGNLDCNSASLTQQTDIGVLDGLDGDSVEHEVDTMPANSGSPVIWEANGYAIAIHTTGGCDSIWSEYDNGSTWFGDSNLAPAVQGYNPANRFWVDLSTPSAWHVGTVIWPYNTVAGAVAGVADGADVQIYEGDYTAAAGNTFVAGTDGRAMTLQGVWGPVTIGN